MTGKRLIRYFFVYGSLLNEELVRHLCPEAQPYALARLENYTREWRGTLTVVPAPKEKVTGAVYQVHPACEWKLDRFEDYPRRYAKKELSVVVLNDDSGENTLRARVYVMNGGEIAKPDENYLTTCLEGARQWGISVDEFFDTMPDAWGNFGRTT